MAGRVEFQPNTIVTTMKRGEGRAEKVTLALVGLEGGDYHLEPGPKPAYDEQWADPDPDALRLTRNNKAEDITIQMNVPPDAKFGTHHFQLIAQNDNEPVDKAAMDIAVTVPFDTRNVLVILLIVLILIIIIVVVVLALSGKLAQAPELSALLSSVPIV
jgi:hypothetical protein